ncbi:MAG: FecR domain-containing protein [Anaerolineales bacterium]|nr:FecR domain-containing protein [Anaerolineales bacterium]
MNPKTLLKWLIPIGLLIFICIGLASITGGIAYLNQRADQSTGAGHPAESFSFNDLFKGVDQATTANPTAVPDGFEAPGDLTQVFLPVFSKPLVSTPQSATLQSLHGIVQVQEADNSWKTVQTIELKAGQTIRIWASSSAVLHFFDGSYVVLAPNTRLTLETVNMPTDGAREVKLFQPYGGTTHHIAQLSASAIAYHVRTPSSTGTATGTIFEVTVQEDKTSQFSIMEGVVEVTGHNATVLLTAGQTSFIANGDDPSAPIFWLSGEGEVTQTGGTWIIGGLEFQIHPDTVFLGEPQVGDIVSVRGRLLPDGSRLADRINLLVPSLTDRFRFTGLVESMGADVWEVSGQQIAVGEITLIGEGIELGSRVLVTGVIRTGGVLFATSITLLDEDTFPFEFTGLVENIDDHHWMIGGIVITLGETTVVTGDPVVGDLVHVEGRVLEDGTWLARAIEKVEEADDFEIIGIAESIAPWIVSAIGFEVNEFTQIESGIVVGSTVRVTGRILEDGTWLARAIERLDERNTLIFLGIVDSVDPWVVNGLSLTTDENTVFIGDIIVSSLVRVTVLVQPDGTWLVLRMELIDVGPVIGCIEFVDAVVGLTREEITLATGIVIPRAIAEIEGDLQIGSRVVVKLCFGQNNVMVYAWVFVIDDPLRPTPTPRPDPTNTPSPPPPTSDKVTICHIPPGNPGNAHTITVGASAVDAHLAHGDHLGQCTGNEGD